jgi:N-formylglutamate deformylase
VENFKADKMVKPIILHIPHSSKVIPKEVRRQILLSDMDLETELGFMTDSFTNQLFPSENYKNDTIIFPISRLIVDPEKFIDDEKEVTAKFGMGVIYLKSSKGKHLRKELTEESRSHLLDKYYFPHHKRLTELVQNKIDECGICLILDCHSFPSVVPYPFEIDTSTSRPDFCIGTDSFHTPEWLKKKTITLLETQGYSTEINKPFSGSIVPEKYYHKNSNVLSIMIEVNRKLYMDEETIQKNNNFIEIKKTITKTISKLETLVENQLTQ